MPFSIATAWSAVDDGTVTIKRSARACLSRRCPMIYGAPLEKEATKPAAQNLLQQQARFDDFLHRYNEDGRTRRST
jgi:hypothetical protein